MRNLCLALTLLLCTACMAQEPHVILKGERFTVDLAETAEQQALGLMFREEMADDHGMLFIFPVESRRSFWMKNTRIPLDIFYFDGELKLVSVAENARAVDNASLLARDIQRYLQDNYARDIAMRDIAAQVHLSERHTRRLFQQVTGQSIKGYLTQVRLQVAAQSLLDPRLSVTDVAHACGYQDVRYFITLFRKHTGLTPAAYRRAGGTKFLNTTPTT